MRFAFRLGICGLWLLLMVVGHVATAQDNPNLDTPPLRPDFGPTPSPASIRVLTTPDGFDNFDLGTTNAEPHISTNPLNPLWFFTAFNTNSAFRSSDGLTWTASTPNFQTTVRGDPVTAYDSLGNLYYETMYGASIVGCKVMRSSDNGATWSAPVTSVDGVDKNWIAADQTMGPFANYVYTCMTASGGRGNFARSTDFGATWQTTFSPTTQTLPGMMVAVGPNVLGGNNISGGCVYVVTHSGSNAAGIYTFYRSTDGGATFSLMSSQQYSNLIGTQIGGRSTVQGMRTRPYPFIAADNSFGPYRGRLYLVYASNNPAGDGNKSDIFLRYSTDQGATWSPARVVNDDPNPQNHFQFFPAIWCDKETGRLYLKWYDTRRVPTSDSMDVYATYTDDGGNSFAPNERLTNQTFRISLGGTPPAYQGDYDGITSNAVTSLAVWTDFRNRNYLGMVAFFPDFAMLTRAQRDTLSFIDSTTASVVVPAVKAYQHGVKFTVSVSPSAPFVFSWPQGDSLARVPDSLTLKIRTNNVPTGNYTVTIIGAGPNGTPVHRRVVPIRVQYIPNTVAVLQPNGGEIWIQGQSRQITWRRTGAVGNVRIEYSTNNGAGWLSVAASVPAASGTFTWTVPATPTSQARVRIAWTDSLATVLDMSDAAFTISGPAALISTTTDTLRAVLAAGNTTGFDTLMLANSGTITLSWSATGPTWANAQPPSGSVPADSTRRIPVRFNASGLVGGTYLGNLSIASNDPYRNPLLVPLRLRVSGIARIRTSPADTLAFGAVRLNTSDTLAIRIRNTGTDTLYTTHNVTPPFRFTALATGLRVAPNDSVDLPIRFNPVDSTSTYVASLRIVSNDPDPAYDTLFVTLTGRGAGLTSVALTREPFVPETYSLSQNYPNPFNPSTTIQFGIPGDATGETTLKVFDMLGREVATLVNERLAAGMYSVRFETQGLASGMYLYRISSGHYVETRKMLLTK